MSQFSICFLVAILTQTTPLDNASAGSQLQLGSLQAPAGPGEREPSDTGPAAPIPSTEPSPAALQAPASAPPRSFYDSQQEAAADSAPRLAPSRAGEASNEPAVLPSETLAESLLQEALSGAGRDGVRGSPVTLKALLGQTSFGTRRVEHVAAYWRLTHAIAVHHFALDEERFLLALDAAGSRDDQPLLAAAQATAKAERAESRLAALRAQRALAQMVSAAPSGESPLPADPPFVGVYRTYFKELNERGAAAEDLRQIDETLPVVHDVIDAQAEAVGAAGRALSQIQRVREQGQASLVQVLDAHERLRRHRRAFLAAVEQYNGQIARYALSVAVPAATGERVVGMLIGTGRGHKSVLASKKDGGQIQRVSGEEPVADQQGGPVFRTPKIETP